MPKSLNKTYENPGFSAQILWLAILTNAVKDKKAPASSFQFQNLLNQLNAKKLTGAFFQISEFTGAF